MSSMWFMSIVVLLVVDVRTRALQQETQPHRCHQCSPSNTTSCQYSDAGWLTATCPSSRPFCATVAIAPDFASSLGCAAAAAAPCSLTNSPRQTLELTCICLGHLCNAPYSDKIRNELLNFSSSSSNDSALTEEFFKLSNFTNVTESAIYKVITVASEATENFTVSTLTSQTDGSLSAMPRAEALKQQTAPSDDEEDDNEGSGLSEESRLHIQSESVSAPAAPSSLLPSEENNACSLTAKLTIPFAFIYFLA